MKISFVTRLILVLFLCLVTSCKNTKYCLLPRCEYHQDLDSHYFNQLEETDLKIIDCLHYLYSRQQISIRKYGVKAKSSVFKTNIPISFEEYLHQRKELLQELEDIMINERNNKRWSMGASK